MGKFERFTIFCRIAAGASVSGLYFGLPSLMVILFSLGGLGYDPRSSVQVSIFIVLWACFTYRSSLKYRKWLQKLATLDDV